MDRKYWHFIENLYNYSSFLLFVVSTTYYIVQDKK